MNPDNNLSINYFGYGANKSSDMMEAIIGRRPDGFAAKLNDYELCIQNWKEIPEKARAMLQRNWGQDFKTYFIRAANGKIVSGHVWILTSAERELVTNWEFWYEPINVQVSKEDGQPLDAETDAINNLEIGEVVDGQNYQIFLNNKDKMFEAAKARRGKMDRSYYLKQQR